MSTEIAKMHATIGADTTGLKKGLKESKGHLEGFKRSVEQSTNPLRQMASAAGLVTTALGVLTAASVAAKKVFDWGYEAAQIKRLEDSGAQLASSLGSNFAEMSRMVDAATLGTVRDAQIFTAANRAMMLEVTANSAQMANLAKVAAFRGRALNVSTEQAFSDIVTGIGRMSPLILDNLGIVINAEKRYQEYADAHGIAADAIDDTAKKQILLNSVLEEGNRQIAAAGGLALDAAAKYEKFNAAWADYTLALKSAYVGGENGVNALADFLNVNTRLHKEVDRGNISMGEARTILAKLVLTGYDATEANRELDQMLSGVTRTSQELATKQAMLNGELGRQATAAGQAAAGIRMLTEAQMKAALSDLGTLTGSPLKSQNESFARQQQALQQDTANLRYQIQQLQSLSYLTPEQQAQLAGLQTELRNNAAAMRQNAQEHTMATRQILFNMMAQRIGQTQMDDATRAAAYNMLYQMGSAWGLIDQATMTALSHMDSGLGALARGNIQAAQREMATLKNLADSMVGVYPIVFDVRVTGQKGALSLASKITGRGGDINEIFAPAPDVQTLNPRIYGGFGGGGGSSLGSELGGAIAQEVKKSKTQIWMETASALSQIGSMAAERIRTETIDPLKKQIEAYDKLIRAGHIDASLIDQTADAERKRAEAAERVAKAEEKIAALQKQQQRLAFLESQVRLLDLIKENNLNAENILGGLKLGIDANMEDVIGATPRAMGELIAKTEAKLGINSKSKVFQKIGAYSAEGFAYGWTDQLRSTTLSFPGVSLDGGGAAAGPQNVTIHLNIENLADQIGVEHLAKRIAAVLQTRYN